MIVSYKSFSAPESLERIQSILDESDTSFEELNSIPSASKLTFTNGFYVYCTALFIDIRNSSNLPNLHKRPKLAKLYRVYISECVAVMNDNYRCHEVTIVGDGISGIFDTPSKSDIDAVFSTAAQLASAIDIINYKFRQNSIQGIDVGIGMEYGRALMVKAGFKGSGINDVVWMGDVVNQASRLCSYGNKTLSDDEIMVPELVYSNLNDRNRSLLAYNYSRGCYHGNVISSGSEKWLQAYKSLFP